MRKNNKNTTILSESTIRRFMKLANIEPLTENYFGQFAEAEEEEGPPMDDESDGEDMGGDEDMPPMDDMGGEEPSSSSSGMTVDLPEEDVRRLVDAIASAVGEVTGVEVTASSSGEDDDMGGLDDEGDMGDDMGGLDDEEDMGGEEDDEDEMLGEMEDMEDEEEGPATRYESLLMKRVARRVAERLMAEAKQGERRKLRRA
jgi:hypothetical protein